MLLKSKNRTNNLKNNRILPKSNIITVKKWLIMLISILTKSQNPSFGFGNFFINDSGQYRSCFSQQFFIPSFWPLLIIFYQWSICPISTIWYFNLLKFKVNLITRSSKISVSKNLKLVIIKLLIIMVSCIFYLNA